MKLPIAVPHGEGLIKIESDSSLLALEKLTALRYVGNLGTSTEAYPYNPNGSLQRITGLTTTDGRVTIMMPHPERVFKTWELSWHPKEWSETTPWMKVFTSARKLV